MSDPLGVTPQDLRATAAHLADTSAQIKEALRSLRETLAAHGAVWGHDTAGKQFAEGSGGYLAQVNFVNGSIDAKTQLLDGYSDGLRNAANTLEQQDTQNGGGGGVDNSGDDGGGSGGGSGDAVDLAQRGVHAKLRPQGRIPLQPRIKSVPPTDGPGADDTTQPGTHAPLPRQAGIPLQPRIKSAAPTQGSGAEDTTQPGTHAPLLPRVGVPLRPHTDPTPVVSGPGPVDLAQPQPGAQPVLHPSSGVPLQPQSNPTPVVSGPGPADPAQPQPGTQGNLLSVLGQLAPSLVSAGGELAAQIPGMFQQNQQPPAGGPTDLPPPPGTPNGDLGSNDGQPDPATSGDPGHDDPDNDRTQQ